MSGANLLLCDFRGNFRGNFGYKKLIINFRFMIIKLSIEITTDRINKGKIRKDRLIKRSFKMTCGCKLDTA